jgi:hypothetical protein
VFVHNKHEDALGTLKLISHCKDTQLRRLFSAIVKTAPECIFADLDYESVRSLTTKSYISSNIHAIDRKSSTLPHNAIITSVDLRNCVIVRYINKWELPKEIHRKIVVESIFADDEEHIN